MHVYGEVHSNVLVLLLLAVQAGKYLLAYLLCVECYIEEFALHNVMFRNKCLQLNDINQE